MPPHTQPSYTFGRGPQGIVARWAALIVSVFNPYRPELHYMRGRGRDGAPDTGAEGAGAEDSTFPHSLAG
jgi:hypothetical protein